MEKETCGFVDFHTHILPGVDDGAKNLEEALTMLKAAWEQGTGTVVLTPHYRGAFRDNLRRKLEPLYQNLVQEAKTICPGLQLYLGCEVSYERDISEKLAQGSVLSINGSRYVLLEFQQGVYHSRLLEGVLELLNFGYVPILAHVERYEVFYREPDLVEELVDLGALVQLNADSVLGKMGFGAKRFCHKLMRRHLVHFIGSDAHNMESRPPELKQCFDKLTKKFGQPYARLLLCENALAVLEDRETIEG